ncbi:Protein of unknown function DUF247, plant [Dillenia turbinata]|uniref:Uncharacterized protein n=1 Tax=Dillenia turbinata TaxID=194707 RepID=A0AAN8UYU0_9MAGN
MERSPDSSLYDLITKELERAHSVSSSSESVLRVPKELREGNEQDYTPKTISIGPLHAGKSNLRLKEEIKIRYLHCFNSHMKPGKTLEDLILVIRQLEQRIRNWYVEPISLASDDFVKMMLTDGCFIAELMWRYKNIDRVDTGDPIYNMRKPRLAMLYNLQRDLLLLENQIPFFVLEHLYEFRKNNECHSLVHLTLSFFRNIMPMEGELHSPTFETSPKHLLDLVMHALFPHPTRIAGIEPMMPQALYQDIISAAELELYGVKFKRGKSTSLADIQFHNGVLEIPPIVVQESTVSLFRNLLALEQCSDEYTGLFTSYAIFMDCLINGEKDVELLLRNGIMQTWVNDVQELVTLFNRLSVDVVANLEDFHFRRLFHDVNLYCSRPWNQQRAYLVRNYYDVRWDLLNSVFLFILTFTQTLFSVLSYYPRNN